MCWPICCYLVLYICTLMRIPKLWVYEMCEMLTLKDEKKSSLLLVEKKILNEPMHEIPTMWYVWPAKPQISLRICAVWSEPLLVAWVLYDCLATDWTPFGVSKLKRRLQRLVRVYTCQNAILLEITCRGSLSMRVEDSGQKLVWDLLPCWIPAWAFIRGICTYVINTKISCAGPYVVI